VNVTPVRGREVARVGGSLVGHDPATSALFCTVTPNE
jgi:hypothetical protein